MPEEITVHYRWTLQELQEATRWHQRGTGRRFRRVGYIVLPVIFVVLVTYFYHQRSTMVPEAPLDAYPPSARWTTLQTWMFVGGVTSFYICLRYFLRLWPLRRIHAASSAKDGEVLWRISEERLWGHNPHAHSEMAWSHFVKALQVPTGLLLYTQPNLFYWLPKAGFANEGDYETVLGWMRRQIPAVQRVS